MTNKAWGGCASNHGRAPQQKHSISEISFLAKMQKMSDDVAESKEKNIQLILNQLTAENFVNLCDELFNEVLEIVQTTTYDKAVLDQQQNPAPGQPTLVELYAGVCHLIVQDNQPVNPPMRRANSLKSQSTSWLLKRRPSVEEFSARFGIYQN
jgi:hypothetical protein